MARSTRKPPRDGSAVPPSETLPPDAAVSGPDLPGEAPPGVARDLPEPAAASEADAIPDAAPEAHAAPGLPGTSSVEAVPASALDAEMAEPAPAARPAAEPEPPAPAAWDVPPVAGAAEPAEPAEAHPHRHPSDSIIPMLIGGVLAAAIGFFAARYLESRAGEGLPDPRELAGLVERQGSAIDALRAELDGIAATDVEAAIGGAVGGATEPLRASLADTSARLDALDGRLAELSERVETVAMRPEAPGLDPGEFDQALSDFRGELQAAIAAAQAEIEEARAEAQVITDRAFASEQAAAARGAWQAVAAALTAGEPFAAELAEARDLVDAEIPAVLEETAPEGIATLADLQERFPERARAALQTSIRSGSDSGGLWDRAGAFLRVQSGVRSLAPREGDDPDAVLSRAEALIRRGQIGEALAEIEALPPEGRNALRPWEADAERRLAALAAADEVAGQLDGR